MAFPPSFLAGALARLTGIGPHRTRPRQPRPVDVDLLDDLFVAGDLLRSSAFQTLALRQAWTLAAAGTAAEQRMAVAEDADGLWLVEPDDAGGWQLVPTDATTLWRRLSALVVTVDSSRG